jgi:pantothenate kinase
MKIAKVFYHKEFSANESKKAYLKACKWVANNVVNKESDIGETFWKIYKTFEDKDKTTFRLDLYCMLDAKDEKYRFCKACKEHHSSFYSNNVYNCNECKMITYVDRIEARLDIKEQYRKERMEFLLNKKF